MRNARTMPIASCLRLDVLNKGRFSPAAPFPRFILSVRGFCIDDSYACRCRSITLGSQRHLAQAARIRKLAQRIVRHVEIACAGSRGRSVRWFRLKSFRETDHLPCFDVDAAGADCCSVGARLRRDFSRCPRLRSGRQSQFQLRHSPRGVVLLGIVSIDLQGARLIDIWRKVSTTANTKKIGSAVIAGQARARVQSYKQRSDYSRWHRNGSHDTQGTGEVCPQSAAVTRGAVRAVHCLNALLSVGSPPALPQIATKPITSCRCSSAHLISCLR